MPYPLSATSVLEITTDNAFSDAISIPVEKPRTVQSTISMAAPVIAWTPKAPPPALCSVRPRSTIVLVAVALMTSMALALGSAGTMPASMPAGLVMVTVLLMLIGPKPALSMAVTSPPGSTTLTACWKVLHGDKNVHGLASLPYEATNTRARAWAGAEARKQASAGASTVIGIAVRIASPV